ncbi:type IV pilus modification PilV family protein [Pseudomonas sp. HK3]
MSIMQRQSGFAMVEVMVTVAIITIGISGMGMLLIRAIQGTQDSAQLSQAMWIVQDYVGRMRSNPEGSRSGFYALDPATIDCTVLPVTMCAETFRDGAEVGTGDCSTDTNVMATFDKWISTCGLTQDIYDSPSDFIINPELTSACTNTSNRVSTSTYQPDCIQYEVTLSWDTRITKVSATEDERINKNDYSMIVEFN